MTFCQTGSPCSQRKVTMSDCFLRLTRLPLPPWDLSNVTAPSIVHMPRAPSRLYGTTSRRRRETDRDVCHWQSMTPVKDFSKVRVWNFTLRTNYRLLFLPLGTNENRRWIMRQRMNLVPEKCSPLWLGDRNASQPLRSCYMRALIWDQRGWCLSSAVVQARASGCCSPANRDCGLTVWNSPSQGARLAEPWTALFSCCWDGFILRQPAIPLSCIGDD